VLGAGTIGVLAAQVLRSAGTRSIVVSEIDEGRRASAPPVEAVVAPADLHETVMELTHGRGADLVVDAVGTDDTRRESLRALRSGGAAIWLGMHEHSSTLDGFDLVVREQRVQGSFAYTDPEFGSALGLLEGGLIDPLVSRRAVPLEESGNVFRRLLHGDAEGVLKAIVTPV
jgi:threonine dehydrogenase-like Zn-dependent dehydrogenase